MEHCCGETVSALTAGVRRRETVSVNNVPRGARPPLDPWYVTGFVEGEGTFTFSRTGARRQNYDLYFAVKLSAVDAPILEDLRDFFGVGNLYDVRARMPATTRAGRTKAARYFRVSATSDLTLVIGHFEEFPLRGAKSESFAIWKEMVRLKHENFRKPPHETLAALAEQLTQAAPRNREPEKAQS